MVTFIIKANKNSTTSKTVRVTSNPLLSRNVFI